MRRSQYICMAVVHLFDAARPKAVCGISAPIHSCSPQSLVTVVAFAVGRKCGQVNSYVDMILIFILEYSKTAECSSRRVACGCGCGLVWRVRVGVSVERNLTCTCTCICVNDQCRGSGYRAGSCLNGVTIHAVTKRVNIIGLILETVHEARPRT